MIDLRIGGRTAFLDLRIQQAKLEERVRQEVRDLARVYRQRLLAELRKPKRGKVYGARKERVASRRQRVTVTFGGQTRSARLVRASVVSTAKYTASAPGEAPAEMTGTLLRSIRVRYPPRGRGWSARIFADRGMAWYRHFLEFGTKERTTICSKKRLLRARRANPLRSFTSGRVLPRPVFSPLQADLERDLMHRINAAVAAFAGGR